MTAQRSQQWKNCEWASVPDPHWQAISGHYGHRSKARWTQQRTASIPAAWEFYCLDCGLLVQGDDTYPRVRDSGVISWQEEPW